MRMYGEHVRITDKELREIESVKIFAGIWKLIIDESIPEGELRLCDQAGNVLRRIVNIGC